MKTLELEQGTPEWRAARAGFATASEFSSILAKGQGKTRASYLRRIVAERLIGGPIETFKNIHMDRGNDQEVYARAEYETRARIMVDQVGFVMHDTLKAGASPDGLIDEDGGCEIKSVIPTVQLDTILAGGFPSEHKAQIQGNLWITGRKWWEFVSFCPEMPHHLQIYSFRVMRDESYIAELESEVVRFLAEVDATVAKLNQIGCAARFVKAKAQVLGDAA